MQLPIRTLAELWYYLSNWYNWPVTTDVLGEDSQQVEEALRPSLFLVWI